MEVCNSPDIFQEKMNEMFCGIRLIRAYIDDLLIITKVIGYGLPAQRLSEGAHTLPRVEE